MILNNPISLLLAFGCIMVSVGIDGIVYSCDDFCLSPVGFFTLFAYSLTITGFVITTYSFLKIEELVKKSETENE